MKKVALLCLGLAFGAVNAAEAQLTMQMSNGWSFTFAGNVNSFLYYTKSKTNGTTAAIGGLVPAGGVVNATRITVGLLPAFAVVMALVVHSGFATRYSASRRARSRRSSRTNTSATGR